MAPTGSRRSDRCRALGLLSGLHRLPTENRVYVFIQLFSAIIRALYAALITEGTN